MFPLTLTLHFFTSFIPIFDRIPDSAEHDDASVVGRSPQVGSLSLLSGFPFPLSFHPRLQTYGSLRPTGGRFGMLSVSVYERTIAYQLSACYSYRTSSQDGFLILLWVIFSNYLCYSLISFFFLRRLGLTTMSIYGFTTFA